MVIDAAIAESVAWRGQLLVPFVDVRYFPIERFGFGYPPDQHPPLWPLLGAALVWLTGDGYSALKLVSLLIGIALIPLTYFALRRHIGQPAALFASALTAGSFPLVDFSGNGSLWALLAALYLCWLWVLPIDDALTQGSASEDALSTAARREYRLRRHHLPEGEGESLAVGCARGGDGPRLPDELPGRRAARGAGGVPSVQHGRNASNWVSLAGPALSAA